MAFASLQHFPAPTFYNSGVLLSEYASPHFTDARVSGDAQVGHTCHSRTPIAAQKPIVGAVSFGEVQFPESTGFRFEKYVLAHHARLNAAESRKLVRGKFQIYAEAGDSTSRGEGVERALQTPIDQSKKIVALESKLLNQIEERKKVVTALKDDLGSSAEQLKSIIEGTEKEDSGELPHKTGEAQNQFFHELKKMSNVAPSTVNGAPSLRTLGAVHASTLKPGNPVASLRQFKKSHRQKSSSPLSSARAPAVSSPVLDLTPKMKKPLAVEKSKDEQEKKESLEPDVKVKEPPLAGPNVMNLIFVAAECAPWSKTGGLGDVVGALPKALARRGHRVMVVAPRYSNYPEAFDMGVRKRYKVAGQDLEVLFFHGYIDGVDYVFVENAIYRGYVNNMYGGSREEILKRMVLLCRAAVEVQWHLPCGGALYGDGNLVFIANDWHTALLPVYLQAYYRDHGLMQYARAILVIHNMAHQGRGPVSDFHFLDLPDHYLQKFELDDPIGGQHLNIFMAGLLTAHRIVTVSHGYARECQTQEGGWGLDHVVRENNFKLQGIVNGIDDSEWNPEVDIFLKDVGYANYTIDTLETGKAACKAAIQKELRLPLRSDVPLVGFIGRLDHQKGVDIIADGMHWLVGQDLQLIMLGSGQADLESMLRSFEGLYPEKVRGWVGFSVKTAHRITAAADIILMPSRFEPCGLNQLYAMRYGTVPVVHAVGGLRDTVIPFDPYANTGTGWTFAQAHSSAMINALANALRTYRNFKDSWLGLQKRCMIQDLSWDKAAKQYEEVLVAAKYQW